MFDGLYISALESAQAFRTAMSAPPRECRTFKRRLAGAANRTACPAIADPLMAATPAQVL